MKPWTIGDYIRLFLFVTLVIPMYWLVIANHQYTVLERRGCAPESFVQYLLPQEAAE